MRSKREDVRLYMMRGRENPSDATPRLRGHTNVPWVPGTCNAPRRQIMWVTNKKNAMCGLKHCGKGRENPNDAQSRHWGHTNVPWASNTYSAKRLSACGSPVCDTGDRGLKHYGKDRENLRSAIPPRGGHTNVPWVPVMWNGDSGRQTMEVTEQSNATTTLNDFGPGAAVLSLRGQEDISCREDRSVII